MKNYKDQLYRVQLMVPGFFVQSLAWVGYFVYDAEEAPFYSFAFDYNKGPLMVLEENMKRDIK